MCGPTCRVSDMVVLLQWPRGILTQSGNNPVHLSSSAGVLMCDACIIETLSGAQMPNLLVLFV